MLDHTEYIVGWTADKIIDKQSTGWTADNFFYKQQLIVIMKYSLKQSYLCSIILF